jgi:ATP-binding cassette subfamily B protein
MSRGPPRAQEPSNALRWANLKEAFAKAPRTLALVWKSSPAATLILGILTLVSAALPLAIAWTGKAIIDSIVAKSKDEALRWVLIELALIGAQVGITRGLALVRQTLGARLSLDINVQILEKALALELRHFEDPEFYDRLTRARREASSRPVSVVTELFQLLQNTLTLAGYVAVLVAFSGWVVLALSVAALPAAISEMRFSSAAFRMRNWRSPDARKLNYLEYVLANDDHAKEVKLFGLGPMLLGRYRTLGEKFYEEDKKLSFRRAGWGYALSLVGTASFYGAYAAMALSAALGKLTIGEVSLYLVAFRQGQQAFQSCLAAVGGMYEDNLYMTNLFEYLAIPVADVRLLPPEQTRVEEGIRFEGVGFRYPGSEKWALRNISLYVPKGQSLALVGHNGAGKTTFIKLLSRLYEPTEGRILLDGRDLRSYEPDVLRHRIAVVFQDYNEYQFKVRENVGVGDVGFLDDEPRVTRAVDRGGASELVKGLEGGLDAQLGRWFKDGVELSGGQWQKLALARAFMREGADVLVLDEPTAALDAESEHQVFERVRQLASGRTTILISHRFSTVRQADRIIVIEAGELVEEGSHHELLARNARYAQLFQLQARGYL